MTFNTCVSGIPCQCRVTFYQGYRPGNYFEPPDAEEFEFEILDRRGRRARWLERKLTEGDEARLLAEYRAEEGEAA